MHLKVAKPGPEVKFSFMFSWVAFKELKLSYYIIHHNGESNGKENGK